MSSRSEVTATYALQGREPAVMCQHSRMKRVTRMLNPAFHQGPGMTRGAHNQQRFPRRSPQRFLTSLASSAPSSYKDARSSLMAGLKGRGGRGYAPNMSVLPAPLPQSENWGTPRPNMELGEECGRRCTRQHPRNT